MENTNEILQEQVTENLVEEEITETASDNNSMGYLLIAGTALALVGGVMLGRKLVKKLMNAKKKETNEEEVIDLEKDDYFEEDLTEDDGK